MTTRSSDQDLTALVNAKRLDVEQYLESTTWRNHRLINLNVTAGSIAAVLTAPRHLVEDRSPTGSARPSH